MKFTEKYEILELLTSGRVSTFLARERASQAQAVVHTFECPAAIGCESETSSIIKHFATLAPGPAEPVTEVGFDEGSSSAYIVTRVPGAGALQTWVRAYRSFAEGHGKEVSDFDENATAELSASEVEKILRQNDRARNQRPLESATPISTESFSISAPSAPPKQGGEFTRLFEQPEAFRPLSESGAPRRPERTIPERSIPTGQQDFPPTNYGAKTPTAKARVGSPEPVSPERDSPEPASSEPGSFTQQFFSGTDDASNRFGLGNPPEPSAVKEPGPFTKEFRAITGKTQQSADPAGSGGGGKQGPPAKSSAPAPGFGSEPPSTASRNPAEKFDGSSDVLKSSTGEFTSFFRGPFEQPAASEKPFDYPDPTQASPPSPRSGDFTQMFGPETRLGNEESRSGTPSAQDVSKAQSFTQIFSENTEGGARLGVSSRLDPDLIESDSLKPAIKPTASPSPPPAMFSGTVSPSSSRGGSFSPPEAGSVPSGGESTFLNRSGRNDATNVFQPRGGEGPSTVQEAPSGPSEFTMFLDRSQLRAILPPEPAIDPAAPGAPRAPAFAMPPMPQAPKPPYAMPAPPPMPPAQMPPMALPQAPPAPRPPVPGSGRAASYWPLITVFTVLFAIAALLVMYFALKH